MTTNAHNATPKELVNLVAELRREGKTYSEIGDITGRPKESIDTIINNYHLAHTGPPPFWTVTKIGELKELNSRGLSASQMGRELGCGRNAVIGKLHRLHVAFRNAPYVNNPPHRKARRPSKRLLAPSVPTREAPGITDLPVVPSPLTWVFFANLEPDQCRWPAAGEPGPRMRCCGAPQMADCSYCAYHHKRGTVANRSR